PAMRSAACSTRAPPRRRRAPPARTTASAPTRRARRRAAAAPAAPAPVASGRASGPTWWVAAVPNTQIGRNLTIFAFFAVLSISGLIWLAIGTGQRFGPLPPQYILSFSVRDADGLAEGSDVRIAGIQVGKVNKITT